MTRIAIIGAGVSGLVSACTLSKEPNTIVTIFEKGQAYTDRLADGRVDKLSGVGGAGTISGGKLCFPPASSGVWRKTGLKQFDFANFLHLCLEPFIDFKNKPVVNSTLNDGICFGVRKKEYETKLLLKDDMHHFVNALLTDLQGQNVDINTMSRLVGFTKKENMVELRYDNNNNSHITTDMFDYVIIASGRSSAKDIKQWFPKKEIAHIAPDLGIRVSVGNGENELLSKHGQDVKLKAFYKDIGVRTFCVCSGGDKTLVEYEHQRYYDGHFNSTLSNIVNFGVLVRNSNIVGADSAVEYCKAFSRFVEEDISLKDFIKQESVLQKANSKFGYVFEAINEFITQLVKTGTITQNLDKYQVFMPSVDRLNPVISTNEFFESVFENIYVIGDAAGISRGFIQSMWSAYHASENILWKMATESHKDKRVV